MLLLFLLLLPLSLSPAAIFLGDAVVADVVCRLFPSRFAMILLLRSSCLFVCLLVTVSLE